MTALICAIFFASGFAALVFEALWFRQAGLALGSSIWASSLVLSGFMAGLALGNGLAARWGDRLGNPFRAYAGAEVAIAVTGVGIVHLLPGLGVALAPLLQPLADLPWLLNPLRLGVAFVVLLIPSTAMGVTLPLLTRTLMAYEPRFGPVLGRLYGWNTAGAMAGAVVGELYLVELWGVRGTAAAAGLLNLLVAAVSLWLAAGRTRRPVLTAAGAVSTAAWYAPAGRPWIAAAFLSGFCLLALEVVWFRLLLLFVLGHAVAFALMLGVVLAGIAAGGLAAGRWLRRAPDGARQAGPVAAGAGLTSIACYAAFPYVVAPFETLQIMAPGDILWVAAPLMLPVSLLSGAFFTLAGAGLRGSLATETETTGVLTLANTAGAALGSLAGGLVLLPGLGVERTMLLLAAIYGSTALLLWTTGGRRRRVALPAAAAILAGAWLGVRGVDERLFAMPVERYAAQREFASGAPGPEPVVADLREGLTETLLYLAMPLAERPVYHAMFMNSVAMADTDYQSRRYMKLYAYLPLAVHPDLKRALLICYGIGNTAKALTDAEQIERVDVVDISRDVLETSRVIYPDAAERPLADPRVRVHVEDGRYFLQTTRERFDLITAEPPPPTSAGVVNLYTREYFELMRERLTEGGIATYWLPLHGLTDVSTRAILRGFCDAFDDCSLWNGMGTQLMMVGTRNAAGPVSEEHFLRQWRDPRVSAELERLGLERPEQLGTLFIGDAEYLDTLTAGVPALVDDDPKLVEAPVSSPEAAEQLLASVRDVAAAQERFRNSPLVARLWPTSVRRATLPFFGVQEVINAFSYGAPPVGMPEVHGLLTGTGLRTLPLWLLGSDPDVQLVIDAASEEQRADPELQFHLGLRRIAERDYAAADAALERAEASERRRTEAFGLRVYALSMAGRVDEAAGLARARDLENLRGRGIDPDSLDDAELSPFWAWMTRTFGFEMR